jgi:D-glycero-alpha-D-manno-heptose-7-phosphate kinase
MIITRTPFRISFFGGGTDYPTWFEAHGGAVLGTAIDKYCYISLRTLPPFFAHKHKIVYSKVETVAELAEIQHPAVRAVLQEHEVGNGLEIHHDADLPARSGLGSSSSFTIGLVNALRAYQGRMSAPTWLAYEATRIEQQVIGEKVGNQDQAWAALGGTNVIEFKPDASLDITPVIMTRDRAQEFNQSLMLFFTGFSRIASTVAEKKIQNLRAREQQLHAMRSMVDTGLNILQDRSQPITDFGELLHEAWTLKRQLADEVSTSAIDEIYAEARAAGATGGKLLGAGGGGFMLFFAEPDKQPAIRQRLTGLTEVTFRIGAPGSKVIVYEPESGSPEYATMVN